MPARGHKLIKIRRRVLFKHTVPTIRRDDRVQVMSGDDRGKVGKVLRMLPARERVVIEGVNMIFKHVRRSQQSPQGGRMQHEGPIHLSNVLLWCEPCGRGRRVRMNREGKQPVRVCAECAGEIK